jgi:hypothetical protein
MLWPNPTRSSRRTSEVCQSRGASQARRLGVRPILFHKYLLNQFKLNSILNQFPRLQLKQLQRLKLKHNWLKSPEDHKQTNIISLNINQDIILV